MTLARDTSPSARRAQLDALRRVDGATRLAMTFEMSEAARRVSEAGIRHRHPEWSDGQVHDALLQLLLGPELAGKVRAQQPSRS